ncbi:MAG TPA: hypothetical protein VGQ67_02595 [Candidatus Polarisedimenticolia bacterium]|nr:hypothetical protein [Candidatus Polarisedimenticolia bacterium]
MFRPLESPAIEVNGESQADARLFATNEWGMYIVDLPSESKDVLVVVSRKAILLMRSEVQRRTNKNDQETLSIDPRTLLGDTSYTLSRDGDTVGFQTDISEVRVQLPREPDVRVQHGSKPAAGTSPATAAQAGDDAPAAPGPSSSATSAPGSTAGTPSVASAPTAAPSDEARACVRLETRPTPGIPGCSKSIYLKNTCDTPVAVTMQRTEHLMTGALPEVFSTAVPGGTEEWIGCSWWSGAMAPAQHDIVAAGFLEPRHGHGHGGHP